MGIYWRAGWAWGRKEIDGLEYRGPLGTRSKREVEAAYARWLTDLEEKIHGGTGAQKKKVPFSVAVNNYMDHHFATLKPETRRRYLVSLLNLTPHFNKYSLQQIGKKEIGEFVSSRRQAKSRQGKITDTTIKHDLNVLSGVFTLAGDFELFDGNPALLYLKEHHRRKTLVKTAPRRRYLSHAEEKLVLDLAVEQARDEASIRRHEKTMIAFALALYIDLGCRGQELLNAKHSWVDLSKNEITIPEEFSKTGMARSIPLLPRARRIMERLPRNKHTDLLLWRTKGGKGFADLNKTFQKLAAKVGVLGVEIHDLRRTCGCRLLQDHRMRMSEVSAWLGHASVQQTETTYAFLQVDNLHDAIGGRVQEKAARLYLAEMFQMQYVEYVGTKVGTRVLLAIENKRKNAKGS